MSPLIFDTLLLAPKTFIGPRCVTKVLVKGKEEEKQVWRQGQEHPETGDKSVERG